MGNNKTDWRGQKLLTIMCYGPFSILAENEKEESLVKIIAVDFDGTVVKHEYPKVGPDVPHAVETLKEIVSYGHKIILWTMRSGQELTDAVQWFKDKGIRAHVH